MRNTLEDVSVKPVEETDMSNTDNLSVWEHWNKKTSMRPFIVFVTAAMLTELAVLVELPVSLGQGVHNDAASLALSPALFGALYVLYGAIHLFVLPKTNYGIGRAGLVAGVSGIVLCILIALSLLAFSVLRQYDWGFYAFALWLNIVMFSCALTLRTSIYLMFHDSPLRETPTTRAPQCASAA